MTELGSLEFFKDVIDRFHAYYHAHIGRGFTDQHAESLKGIYDLVVEANPDQVIEIGTCHGSSTIAIATALKTLGKDLTTFLSIDLSHKGWEGTKRDIVGEVQREHHIDLNLIRCLDSDFKNVDPSTVITGTRVLVFYDIHDRNGSFPSKRFVDKWIPLLKNGVVAVHDVVHVDPSYVTKDAEGESVKTSHFEEGYFIGYLELQTFMDWLNKEKVPLRIFPTGIFFSV